jgi:hypothetical protein
MNRFDVLTTYVFTGPTPDTRSFDSSSVVSRDSPLLMAQTDQIFSTFPAVLKKNKDDTCHILAGS